MSVNSILKSCLDTNGYPVEFNKYEGSAYPYFVFNFADERGVEFCDDQPEMIETSIQIHLFCLATFNHLALKNKVRNDLSALYFSFPTVQTFEETDESGIRLNHLVFECEYVAAKEV